MISNNVVLTSVDSDKPFKLKTPNDALFSSLTVIDYITQTGLSICWSHIPYCWKSHVTPYLYLIQFQQMYKELNMTIVKRRATHNDKLLFGYTNRVFFKCSCIIELIKSVEEKR